MYTLDTILSPKSWSHDFWRMVWANFLLTAAMFMTFSALNMQAAFMNISTLLTGVTVLHVGVGMYFSGPFCSFLLDRYRRKGVCLWSMVGLVLFSFLTYDASSFLDFLMMRFCQGFMWGLVQYSLITLLLDLTVSEHRSEAEFFYSWAQRVGFAVGLTVGLVILKYFSVHALGVAIAAVMALSFIMIKRVSVPFRAPLEPPLLSLDRFLLPQAAPIFLVMLPATVSLGMFLFTQPSMFLSGGVLLGFVLTMFLRNIVFASADVRSEVVMGYLLLGASCLLAGGWSEGLYTSILCSFTSGVGVAMVTAKLLAYFIKLSGHCQRGTIHSTYMLCWETGICLGYYLCARLAPSDYGMLFLIMAALSLFTIVFYIFVVHGWFMRNRHR